MSSRTILRSGLLLALLALAGCNQILGVEVQKLGEAGAGPSDDDGGTDAGEEVFDNPSAEDCDEYCGLLDKVCNPMTGNAAFGASTYCKGLCPFMQIPRTELRAKTGNTFDCRLRQANLAESVGLSDNSAECKSSGAGGNDSCGSNCEGYCQLFASVCADFPELLRGETCLSECQNLAVDATKNAAAAFSMGADTLQCRLAHLGAASVDPMAAKTHCAHATIAPAANTPCQPATPTCEHYCSLVMNTCTDKRQQYDSANDCLATCRTGLTLTVALGPEETAGDQTHDTVACRRYHAYNALKAPDSVHCEHAGPSGDGHCGRICPAYCQLAKAACGTQFATEYPKGDADCLDDCSKNLLHNLPVADQLDEHFSVANAKKAGTVNCRIYHATKAFRSATTECASVFGGGECE